VLLRYDRYNEFYMTQMSINLKVLNTCCFVMTTYVIRLQVKPRQELVI